MKVGKVTRVVLDVALTVMIVLEMLIQFTGGFLHEVIGLAFFATVMVHIVFSAAWVKKTARNAKSGKLTARRTALAIVGSLLALTTVVLGVSSIAISGILYSAGFVWPIGEYSLWASVHTFAAYALCALVVVHLAMHWVFLASAFKVPYDPSRRRAIGMGVNAMAALGVLALGVAAVGEMTPSPASAGQGAFGADAASGASNANGGSASSASANSAIDAGESSGAPSAGSSSGKTGKQHGKGSSAAPTGSPSGSASGGASSSSSSGSSSGNSNSGSVSGSSSSSSSQPSSGSRDSANSGNASGASGICALCRKQCPLSAPKCEKPYEAGLI